MLSSGKKKIIKIKIPNNIFTLRNGFWMRVYVRRGNLIMCVFALVFKKSHVYSGILKVLTPSVLTERSTHSPYLHTEALRQNAESVAIGILLHITGK